MQTPNIEIKAHSKHYLSGVEAVTFLIKNFPYRLIQEAGTHRLINSSSTYSLIDDINPFTKDVSRNSASTRAVPVNKIIDKILEDPYIPTFTRNVKGMQGVEDLSQDKIDKLTEIYIQGMNNAINIALWMNEYGAHKQEINGILSPYLKIPILMTATEWSNFFNLRDHDSTHPDFRCYVVEMKTFLAESKPKIAYEGDFHLPYFSDDLIYLDNSDILDICAARNARLSYYNFEGTYDIEKDIKLSKNLFDDPLHGSPFEHNLIAENSKDNYKNFTGGWMSQRMLIENKILEQYIE
jgi:Thymidylate synthase complementing protein